MSGPSITARLGLDSGEFDRQLKQAERRQKEAAKSMAAINQEVEESVRQITAAHREELELARLRAKVAGDGVVAAAIEEEIKLKDESIRISRELGVAEHEAYAIAQERLTLEKKLADGAKATDRAKGISNTVKANESLLESDKKVENQLVGLAGNLMRAENAGQATASAIQAVGESLNLSLGAAVGIGVAASLIESFSQTRAAMAAFNEELRTLNQEQGNASYRGLSQLEQRLGNLKDKLDQLAREPGMWEAIKQSLSEASLLGGEGGSYSDISKRKSAQADAVRGAIEQTKEDIAAKTGEQTRIMELEQNGLLREAELVKVRLKYEEQIGEALRQRNVKQQEHLKRQQTLEEAAVNKRFDDEIARGKSAVADQAAAEFFDRDRAARSTQHQNTETDKEDAEQRRQDEREIRNIANETAYIRKQSEIDATQETNKRLAYDQRIELLEKQISDERTKQAEASDDVQREALGRSIAQLEAQRTAAIRDRANLDEQIALQQQDTANKAAQSEIDRLKAVDAVKGAKEQILQIDKQIAQLEAQKANSDELKKGQLDQQIGGLNTQRQQELDGLARRRLMSPDQRRAEDRAGNTLNRARRAAETTLAEAAKTKAKNESVKRPDFWGKGDISKPGDKDPNAKTDFAEVFGRGREDGFKPRNGGDLADPPFKPRGAGAADAIANGMDAQQGGGKTLADVHQAITTLTSKVEGLNFVTPPGGEV